MSVRKQILYAIAAVSLATAASRDVSAQTLDSQQRVLDAITSAADRICNVIKIESTTESVKGTTEVKTELRGMIKLLGDLGINVQGSYNTESYAGVLQAELPSTLKNGADCKLRVLDKLVDRMLHDEPPEAGNLVTTKCDRLASRPSDKARRVGIPGVDFMNIDSARAVSACRDASRVRPNDMRIVFQLGRSLQKDGSSSATVEAARLYKLAADQGYVAAQTNLGVFYEIGRGGLAKNDEEAGRLYKLAADQGYAATDKPMRIVVVRSSQPECEPKCAEWISAEGEIVPATAELLRKIVNSLGGRKLPILIHSGGGLGNQAMLMGFLIRARGLDVAVARTVFDPCANASGGCKQGTWSGPLGEPESQSAFCKSACTFILAGGVRRFVGPEARVGVHNFRLEPAMVDRWRQTYRGAAPIDTVIQRSFAPPIAANDRTYFRKLGVSEDIVDLMVSTPASDMRILTETELLKLRLATEIKDGRAVVYP